MTKKRDRLDNLLVDRGLVETRARGRLLIMAGEVRVDGEKAIKPGRIVSIEADIELIAPMPYVSRGGLKLRAALTAFLIKIEGRICADVGACTGGFTDVLLQDGARTVYAIDVGYGQLDWKLRQDSRVRVMERTNARYQLTMPEQIDVLTIDVSFISLKIILETTLNWLAQGADVVALIKPQFEAGRAQVGKGGVVRDREVHSDVLKEILNWTMTHGYSVMGLIRSPIDGAKGNLEFLVWLQIGGTTVLDCSVLIASVLEPRKV
ncbi:MAG TPA: TlyA family RNA methyltransferase [Patescibacteria group bacterium]|nr:TlyA family RNA methyltransferase [Patescibacteria group bacterium]